MNASSFSITCCLVFEYCHTEYHRLDVLNNRNIFSYSSGGCKFKIKVLAGLLSGETSLPDFQTNALHGLYVWVSLVSPFSWKDTRPSEWGPTFMTFLNLNSYLKTLSLNIVLGIRPSTYGIGVGVAGTIHSIMYEYQTFPVMLWFLFSSS